MKLATYSIVFFFLVSFTGKEPESCYTEFKAWYSENSDQLTLRLKEDIFGYELRYLPKEVKMIRELASKEEVSGKELKELREKYDAYYEFSFKLSVDGVQNVLTALAADEEHYNTLLFYLIENISQDFTLVKESGEEKPLRCSFENNYGAAPYIKLHLVFEKKSGDHIENLIYNDQFFGKGLLQFELHEIDQLKIPKIK